MQAFGTARGRMMADEYSKLLSRLCDAPGVEIVDVSEPGESHEDFTARMIRVHNTAEVQQ
jgi:hypothetical protein